mmetsp:Transcript_23680/g.68115  ORF Transcript_23680/g.68115 Transcript_23680/m.68115 type:complete len:95 (-) Transcript_23680:174-458(-)
MGLQLSSDGVVWCEGMEGSPSLSHSLSARLSAYVCVCMCVLFLESPIRICVSVDGGILSSINDIERWIDGSCFSQVREPANEEMMAGIGRPSKG